MSIQVTFSQDLHLSPLGDILGRYLVVRILAEDVHLLFVHIITFFPPTNACIAKMPSTMFNLWPRSNLLTILGGTLNFYSFKALSVAFFMLKITENSFNGWEKEKFKLSITDFIHTLH